MTRATVAAGWPVSTAVRDRDRRAPGTHLSDKALPPLTLAAVDQPERPAVPVPVDDHGYMAMLREAEPDLEHTRQHHGAAGTVVHVWRHTSTCDYVVLVVRDSGQHGVKESGAPIYDRLSQLAGMWLASDGPRRGGCW